MVQCLWGRLLVLWRWLEILELKIPFESGLLNLLILYVCLSKLEYVGLLVLLDSSQATGLKNAGWDFSIGGSTGTRTSRNVVRPPQVRDRKPEVPSNHSTSRKNVGIDNQWSSASGTVLYNSSEVSMRKDANHEMKQKNHLEDVWNCYPFLYIHTAFIAHHVCILFM